MTVRVSVVGLRELLQRLAQLDDDAITEAETAAASVIAEAARPPRRTGRLDASLRAQGPAVVSPLPYAGVIHNGWPRRHIDARPFVTESFEAAPWPDAYLDVIERALD